MNVHAARVDRLDNTCKLFLPTSLVQTRLFIPAAGIGPGTATGTFAAAALLA